MDSHEKARRAVLLKKYRAGKTMSRLELQEIGKLPGSDRDKTAIEPEYANKLTLCQILRIEVKQLSKWSKDPGTPGRTPKGYKVQPWKEWYAKNQLTNGSHRPPDINRERDEIALSKAREELEAYRFDEMVKRGKYILKEDVKRQWMSVDAVLQREMRQRFGVIAPEESAQVEGAHAIRKINERHLKELFEFMHGGEW